MQFSLAACSGQSGCWRCLSMAVAGPPRSGATDLAPAQRVVAIVRVGLLVSFFGMGLAAPFRRKALGAWFGLAILALLLKLPAISPDPGQVRNSSRHLVSSLADQLLAKLRQVIG